MIKNITADLLSELRARAKFSERKRVHYNLHPELHDPVQRMIVVIEPGSYIRPHRHTDAGKWELFVLLKGAAVMLIFDEEGRVTQRLELSETGPGHAIGAGHIVWMHEDEGAKILGGRP